MKLLMAATTGLLAASRLATQASDAAGRVKRKYNPNQMICENRDVIGSRLQRVRVCHTAQEWEEVRLQEKVGLMRKQHNGGSGAGGVSVRDSPW